MGRLARNVMGAHERFFADFDEIDGDVSRMSGLAGGRFLDGVALNVSDPAKLAGFYTRHFGMNAREADGVIRLGYGVPGADLALRAAASDQPYQHDPHDRYWKIGITLPNIEFAASQLRAAGISISTPAQFQDIGMMCHLDDPEGFKIELLQHTFAGEPPTASCDQNSLLGGGARIGQITLRTTDIEGDLAHFRDDLGMRLLSVQPVAGRGFTLYFLAYTDESPPEDDLEAVPNRPWLWQRPYTVLELQHLENAGLDVRQTPTSAPGFAGLIFGYPGSEGE